MPQYLVAIHHSDNYDPLLEGEAMIRDIGALNEEMDAVGARFFAGGLESASHAKSLRKQPDGTVSITDGPTSKPRNTSAASGSSSAPTWTKRLGTQSRRRLASSCRGASVPQNPVE